MTLSNVMETFAQLAGLSPQQAQTQADLAAITVREIEKKLKAQPNAEEEELLDYFAAACLLYRYAVAQAALYPGGRVTAGDVTVDADPVAQRDAAFGLKEELYQMVSHLLEPEGDFFICLTQ